MPRKCIGIIAIALCWAATAQAGDSIALSFTPHNDTESVSVLDPATSIGYPGFEQANWNNVTVAHNNNGYVDGSATALMDDTGTPTSMGVTVNDEGSAFMILRSETWGYSADEHTMRRAAARRYLSFTIGDVPFSEYDVYVYHFHWGASNDATQLVLADGATGAVDPTTYFFRYSGNNPMLLATDTAAPAEGNPAYADTVKFTGNTASSFIIQSDDGIMGVGVAGIQIVNTATGPAVLLGDANNDGVVSADDFAAVQTNFGNTGAADGLLPGDANDDGVVSADDFAAIQTNFGNVLGSAAEAAPIPEPVTMTLLAIGALACCRGRRK